MTNDELWDQEIENLRARVITIARDLRAVHVVNNHEAVMKLSAKLTDARKGRFERLDYLTWKLSYE